MTSFKVSSKKTPCPICGRDKEGCRKQDELLWCRIGTTIQPTQRYPDLKPGFVTPDGWACVKISEQWASFKVHEERREPQQIQRRDWAYKDRDGNEWVHHRIDYDRGPKKNWWDKGTRPNDLMPLYYDELPDAGDLVFVVEGETCCDALRELGFTATSVPNGSDSWKGSMPKLPKLVNNDLVLCPDRDACGLALMERMAKTYKGSKWLPAAPKDERWREPTDGYDIKDWIDDGADSGVIFAAIQNDKPQVVLPEWWKRIPVQDLEKGKRKQFGMSDVSMLLQSSLADNLRWNLLSDHIEIDGKDFTDRQYRTAYGKLELANIKASKETVQDAFVDAASVNEYHPIRDYLNACNDPLPDNIWENIAGELLGINATPFDNIALRKWLMFAVARAYKPGCPFGFVYVLVGPQKAGKSRFFYELASRAWFNDGFRFTGKEADDIQSLGQTWIAEWGELDGGIRKFDEAVIKAFISRMDDRTRVAYGTSTEPRPRHFVLCGSTNKQSGFFSDETGNRRFVLAQLGDQKIRNELVAQLRDKIWASAKRDYLAGMSYFLDDAEEDINTARNNQMFKEDPWSDKILEYISGNTHKDFFPTLELVSHESCLDMEVKNAGGAIAARIDRVLLPLGYSKARHKISGHKVSGYWRPGKNISQG